ncbi:MAG TPA: transcriptional repressor [Candidatus Eubacterium avistercoris]|uniref:Transcriptional repressor n=1 Tax=Candidatus Eubacterium avistercoris TaxID=2838567 RepID=A0A9D2D512_9FIRM|nr:transcriptional repressor [Candidatus Eubacterium avistercoris]
MIKRSKQRECIKQFLMSRTDHPTAETIYIHLREQMPSISLGTVYRNLSLLADMGEIRKLSPGMGPDHFDANVMPHNHFICRNCGNILDLNMENIDHITKMAKENFDGVIEDYVTYFYGTCPDCLSQDLANKKTG